MNVEWLKRCIDQFARRHGYHIERVVDYSHCALDIFELLVEHIRPNDPEFFFVQVGAHDGRTGDPIHRLVDNYGWRGVLLEPQPEAFKTLQENYRQHPQLELRNKALSTSNETRPLYTVDGATQLASFDRNVLLGRGVSSRRIRKLDVGTITFAALFSELGVRRVDLLVVDAEGYDYEVVKMAMGTDLPRPRVIRYEHLHLSSNDRSRCADLLADCGYALHRDGRDTIAYRDE